MSKIDVIVPIYNAEKYLEKCLNSIFNQSFKDFNVIAIDDGSTDSSLEICKAYESKFHNFKLKTTVNKGVSSARNLALYFSTATYVVFVDSDDYLEKNYLLLLYNKAIENMDLAICGYKYVDENDNIVKHSNFNLIYDKENLIIDILLNPSGARSALWNKIFSNEIIVTRKIQFNSELRIGEDLLFLIDYMLYSKHFCLLKDQLYNYRVNPRGTMKQIGSTNNISKYFSEWTSLELIEKKINEEKLLTSGIENAIFSKKILTINKLLKYSTSKEKNWILISYIKVNFMKIIYSKKIPFNIKIAVIYRSIKRSLK